ncbi:MAG: valine--tRNA ligase, partial [Proteobacteria bacterium]
LKLRQDSDVLDTWFSSALWPFATLDWPENSDELKNFYPGNVLVTGFDIIFFWVARMIMMGIKFMDEVPFKEVYIHGLVRDSHGQKMSKSKGNVLDPLDVIDGIGLKQLMAKRTQGLMQDQPQKIQAIKDQTAQDFPEGIKAYGCDALRFTFASLASTGRDINFDMGRVEGYRNFCNKIFNAARFVLMNCEDFDITIKKSYAPSTTERWITSRLQQCIADYRKHLDSYRLDLASQVIYDFFWNKYCDWFLEMAKPLLKTDQKPHVQYTLLTVLDQALRLLHPIMPFLTEEIWQAVAEKLTLGSQSIMISAFPVANPQKVDDEADDDIQWLKQLTLSVRQIRAEMNIPPGKPLQVLLSDYCDKDVTNVAKYHSLIHTLARLEGLELLAENSEEPPSATGLIGTTKVLIPLAGLIDIDEEMQRIDKNIAKVAQEIKRAQGKLNNDKFTAKAPESVVNAEREKLQENQTALKELKEQRSKLDQL